MSNTPNPLAEMTDGAATVGKQPDRPNPSFEQSALPGFKKALLGRRSIRGFDGQPLPEQTMRDCLRDATLAPSSSNLQTYELYWVRDPANKSAVTAACMGQPAATTAGDLIVVVARGDLWQVNRDKLVDLMTQGGTTPLPDPLAEYYQKIVPMTLKSDALGFNNLVRRFIFWRKGRNNAFVRTPVTKGDHQVYAHTQAALAAQTLMLSLAAHGYESCPIGGMDADRISAILALPKQAEVSMVIAAGRGTPEGLYGPRLRLPESDLIKEV
ncbi:MAG: nitroreductase family protein [Gammaproteobacteria bacterium]|nr:nitroreductase family protein [Gammaproteobacteria bacterium]